MAGNTSTSSLLRAARAAHTRRLALEDDIAAYEFSLSAKTQGDLREYTEHLNSRIKTTIDPSKKLSYTKQISSARRTYVSHEIQRSTINMLETGAPLTQKQQLLGTFYRSAVANGDMDLAQSLRLQYDRLDVQIQNEREAAARRAQSMAEKMSRAQSVTFEDYADKLLEGNMDLTKKGSIASVAQMGQMFAEKGSDFTDKVFGGSDSNIWDNILENATEAAEAYRMAAEFATADSTRRRLNEKANDILRGEETIEVGGLNLSLQDIRNAADTMRNGFQLYEPGQRVDDTGKVVNILQKTKLTDLAWGRDRNGNYRIVPVRDLKQDDFGSRNDPKSAFAKLEAAGYEILKRNDDGTVQVRVTGSVKFAPELPNKYLSESFSVVLDDQGNARIVSEGPDAGIFRIVLEPEDPEQLGRFEAVSPEEDMQTRGFKFREAMPQEVRAFNDMLQESQKLQEETTQDFDVTGSLEDDESALDTVLGVDRSLNELDLGGVSGPGGSLGSLLLNTEATGQIREELDRRLEVAAQRSVQQAARESAQRLQRTSGQNIQGNRGVGNRLQNNRRANRRLQDTVGHDINRRPIGNIDLGVAPPRRQPRLRVAPPRRRQTGLRVR